jgi:hypothetical protein
MADPETFAILALAFSYVVIGLTGLAVVVLT